MIRRPPRSPPFPYTTLFRSALPPLPEPLPADLPVAVHRISDLDAGPTLRDALGARPDEIWVLRPDGHVAAVVTRSADVAPAVARLLDRSQKDPRAPHRSQARGGTLHEGLATV